MRDEERTSLRLRGMAVFFVRNTNNVDIKKLEKLFYFADMRALEEDGFTISRLKYYACETGPRPRVNGKDLYDGCEFSKILRLNENNFFETDEEFSPAKLSPFEIGILKEVASEYRDSTGDWLSTISHAEGGPWKRTVQSHGPDAEIDIIAFDEEKRSSTEVLSRRKLRERESTHRRELENIFETLATKAEA